jgi:Uma2 family endonuclease
MMNNATQLATSAKAAIDYPETDGKPMAESDLHREVMFALIHLLQRFFAGRQVYVSGNLLIYFEEGNPYKSVAPDCFVAFDIAPKRRRTYKVWEEGKVPEVVFEVSSKKTQREDLGKKMRLYAELGVREYFIYDPTGDYLDPALAAFELVGGGYVPMQPLKEPVVLDDLTFLANEAEPPEYASTLLGLRLTLDEAGQIVLADAASGDRLLSDEEARQQAEQRAAEAENRAAEAEDRAAEAEDRASQAEAENQQLRAELARLHAASDS